MQPIARVSQTDLVVKELTKFFQTDEIQEGDKLPTEMVLCERLKVGRSTVREAVKALQVMGYVQIEPGRGAFLKRKNLDSPVQGLLSWLGNRKAEVADIIEVRMQLEPLAGRLAVERGTDEEIAGIDAIRLEFESVLAAGSLDADTGEHLGALDEKLHAAIAEASHNPLLIHLNALVTVAFKQFRSHSFKVEAHAKNAVSPHRKIVAALQKRDANAAQRSMKDHMFKTLEDISLGAGK